MIFINISKAFLLTITALSVLAQEEGSTLPDATAVGAAPPPRKIQRPANCNKPDVIQPSAPFSVISGYEAIVVSNTMKNPRSVTVDEANHFLVLAAGDNSIYSIREDLCGNMSQQLLVNGSKLGGSILQDSLVAFRDHLYVATGDAVYKFQYSPGQHSEIQNAPEIVLKNIGEKQLPMTIDPRGRLFVPKGFSQAAAGGSQVRQYDLMDVPAGGFDYGNNGEALSAAGNNGAGPLAYDTQGRIWGTNIAADGSENLSLFDANASANTTVPVGSQTRGIAFYRGLGCSVGDADSLGTTEGFPCRWTDHAFLATRNTGVVHVPFSDLAHAPSGAPETIFGQTDISDCSTGTCISPISIAFDQMGRIVTASDTTNEVWMVRRVYNPDAGKILTDKANASDAASEAKDEAKEAAAEEAKAPKEDATVPEDSEN
ncbi:hypothetical protein INT44_008549 [Umbelopsis vinacea]|uniref:Pyrroloquinoline quinone-dependent pyranose dehydrogenase beta-propeller domain-containing protein n=1 Tax=Umbelopsis vinacea TaxID=44442 RepID=A0A8H7UJZ7_9FUNG|nr:hypothetical protein INT44_008549 [Umbelopsis vinacea]